VNDLRHAVKLVRRQFFQLGNDALNRDHRTSMSPESGARAVWIAVLRRIGAVPRVADYAANGSVTPRAFSGLIEGMPSNALRAAPFQCRGPGILLNAPLARYVRR
jgi:hypothetical protein